MVKKINSTQETKLSKRFTNKDLLDSQEKDLGFKPTKKNQSIIKSFRLELKDVENLNKILEMLHSDPEVKKYYKESQVFRGILQMLSNKLNTKQLLQCIKESR